MAEATNGPGDREALRSICRTREEYEAQFEGAVADQTAVEVSPSYLYFSQVSARIFSELEPPKILVLLRNPLHKAYSQYRHLLSKGRETLPYYEALQAEEQRKQQGWGDMWRYAESSLYAPGLARYLEVFGRTAVLPIQSERFFADPLSILPRIFRFLDVDETFAPDVSVVHNQSYTPRSRGMAAFLNQGGRRLRHRLPQRYRGAVRQRLEQANAGADPAADARAVAYLRDYFAADIRETERLLGWQTGWFGPVTAPAHEPQRVDLTLIIVSWNVRDYLRPCLRSVYAATADLVLQIIVVDNGSTDGTVDMLAAEFPQVEVITSAKNLGFGGAHNLAVPSARGRLIGLLNPDTLLLNDVFGMLVGLLEAEPAVGVVGPRLVGPDGTVELTCARRLATLGSELRAITGIGLAHGRATSTSLPLPEYETSQPVECISGACLVLRPTLLMDGVLFDGAISCMPKTLIYALRRVNRVGWSTI